MSDQVPSPWRKTSANLHADCRIFEVWKERWEHPDGKRKGDFFVLHCPGWVNVVARTTAGKLVMVRQFRFGQRELSWEIPGGLMEEGESPEATGARELLEETGYRGGSAKVLGRVHPNPAIQNNLCHVVLIDQVERTQEVEWDGNEELEVREMDVEEVMRMAREGEITHSLVIDALFFFKIADDE